MLIQAEALSREKLLMLLIILSRGVLSRYHVQADALLKGCYYCDPVDALSQSNSTTALTDRCYLLRSLLMKFVFLVRFCCSITKTASCFTVSGMKWSSALCLVFFLLTLKRWYAFFDWIYSVRCLLFDEYDRNGVFENLILWRSVIGWFNGSVYYYYS